MLLAELPRRHAWSEIVPDFAVVPPAPRCVTSRDRRPCDHAVWSPETASGVPARVFSSSCFSDRARRRPRARRAPVVRVSSCGRATASASAAARPAALAGPPSSRICAAEARLTHFAILNGCMPVAPYPPHDLRPVPGPQNRSPKFTRPRARRAEGGAGSAPLAPCGRDWSTVDRRGPRVAGALYKSRAQLARVQSARARPGAGLVPPAARAGEVPRHHARRTSTSSSWCGSPRS